YAPNDGLLPGGAYDIVKDPKDAHRDAASFGDHTNGKGYMMMVNGGTDKDKVLWSQTVAVRQNSEYTFSLWVASWYSGSTAELDIRINGKSVGTVVAPLATGEWKEFKVKWNPGAENQAAIAIYNLNTNFSGNDFAIDDISLQGPPPPLGSQTK